MVTDCGEGIDQFFQKEAMPAYGQALYIFEDKICRSELSHNADKFAHQVISRVVKRTLADHRKTLARRTTEYDIDSAISQAGPCSNRSPSEFGDRLREDCAKGEIEFMYCAMDRIDLDRSYNIEPGLFEAEA
jgi:hypothetical protein